MMFYQFRQQLKKTEDGKDVADIFPLGEEVLSPHYQPEFAKHASAAKQKLKKKQGDIDSQKRRSHSEERFKKSGQNQQVVAQETKRPL